MAKYLNENCQVSQTIQKVEELLRDAGISFSASGLLFLHTKDNTYTLVDSENQDECGEFPRLLDSQRFRLREY